MEGQPRQFNHLYQEFHPGVVRYLARMVSPQDAEDLAQEVFSKVAKNLDRFEGRSKLSTWIYRIATRTALDRMRGTRRQNIEIPLMEEVDSANTPHGPARRSSEAPLAQIIDSEMNACIHQQVDKLPEKYRTVMILSSMQELKNREIAEVLEISLEAVKMRLHRSRAMLKDILEQECRFYHHDDSGALVCDRKLPERS